ncbi:calcium ion binding protein [Aureococcus anophagefferens]|nr:calcium ion binding protein [Aureococcus anophagefferens]
MIGAAGARALAAAAAAAAPPGARASALGASVTLDRSGRVAAAVSLVSAKFAEDERRRLCGINEDATSCPAGYYSGTGSYSGLYCDDGCDDGCWWGCDDSCDASCDSCYGCTACAAGTANPYTGRTSCTSCVAGKYQPSAGQTTCADCWEGSYSAAGATTCASCPAGTYASGGGDSSCTSCPAGTYSAAGATSCTSCAAGTYASASGSSSCAVCPGGQYQGSTGASSCSNCAAGKYLADSASAADHDSSGDCAVCAGGSYQNTAGSTSCASCPAGTYNDDFGAYSTNHDALDDCAICAAGTYVTGSGATACASCPAGTYLPSNYGNAAYVDEASDCLVCPAGSYSAAAATACAACAAGTYLSDAGTNRLYHDSSSDCASCPAGTYQPSSGGASCAACEAGRAMNSAGSTSCTVCGAGTYQASTGAGACDGCPGGKYLADAGTATAYHDALDDCATCPEDFFAFGSANTQCAACPAGEYAGAGSTGCASCAEGAAAAECVVCPGGQYRVEFDCVACPECTFAASSGSVECDDCPEGRYADEAGLSTCHAAAPGYFPTDLASDADGYGVTSGACFQAACPSGFYSAGGATNCAEVPAGSYASASLAGASSCVSCPAGAYGDASGHHSAACGGACAAGRYGASGALTSDCSGPCPAGYRCPAGTAIAAPTAQRAYGLEGCAVHDGTVYFSDYGGGALYKASVHDASTVEFVAQVADPSDGAEACYVRLPSGCGSVLSETTTPAVWFVDPNNAATSCEASRKAAFNSYCGRSDAEQEWRNGPAEYLRGIAYDAVHGYVYAAVASGASGVYCGRRRARERRSIRVGRVHGRPPTSTRPSSAGAISGGLGALSEVFNAGAGNPVTGLAVAGSTLYYAAAGSVLTHDLDGGAASTVLAGRFEHLAVASGTLYAAEYAYDGSWDGGVLAVVDLASGAATTFAAPVAGYGVCADAEHDVFYGAAKARARRFDFDGYTEYCGDGDRAPLVAVACPSSVEVDEKTSGDVIQRKHGDASLGLDGAGYYYHDAAGAAASSDGATAAFWLRPAEDLSSGSHGLASLELSGSSGAVTCALEVHGGVLSFSCDAVFDITSAAVSASVEAPPLDGGSWTHLCVVVSEEGVSIAVDGTFVAQTRSSVGASLSVVSLSVGLSGAFSFAGHVDDVAFVSSDGAASSAVEVDALHCDSYYTTIKATTAATGVFAPGAGYCTFRVDVIDVNDAPYFDGDFAAAFEETVALSSEASIFSIEGGCGDNDLGYFGIEACSGQVYTKTTAFNALETASYEICVTVTDDGEPPLSDVATVYVTILNVNGAPDAADEDGDALTYALSDPHGILSLPDAAAPSLATAVVLDYEAASTYVGVQFSTSDGELEDLVYVAVAVTDVNDAPVWDGATSFAVDEHSAVGTVVGSVAAYASDEDGDALTFSMTVAPSSSLGEFSMSSDGEITVSSNAGLDYEAYAEDHDDDAPTWVATVTVSDGEYSATTTFDLSMANVDDAPTLSGAGDWTVAEDAAVGTVLGTVVADDPDAFATLFVWSLGDDDANTFSIAPDADDATTAHVSLNRAVDYETVNAYDATVSVMDEGGNVVTAAFSLTVTDVNEAPELVANHNAPSVALVVPENTPVGAVLALADGGSYGLDDDVYEPDDGQGHVYDLLDFGDGASPETRFSVDADTSEISTNAAFDYEDAETGNFVFVRARATDDGSPALSSDEVTLCVSVLDVNEAPVVADVAVTMLDNTAVGSTVALLDGFDEDGDALTYSLAFVDDGDALAAQLAAYFWASPGGRLFLNHTADDLVSGDDGVDVVFTYSANDGELGSGDATLTITVLDRGVAPVIAADQHFTIPENSAAGVAVGTLIATDENVDDVLAYFIVGGSGANLFDVGEADGAIAVAEDAALDFETQASYALEVTVTDGFATTYATVGITLSDVNEAPTFPASAVDLAVTEAAAAGAQAGQYREPFAIDGRRRHELGLLSVVDAAALDYETTASYTGTVTATDSAGLTATAFVGIEILDVNEPPSFAASFLNLGSVVENGGFQLVGPLGATDPENDVLDFVLDDAAAAVFEVRDGSLYVRDDGLDFESSSEWSVSVTATESATSEAYAASLDVAVSVVDANDLSIDAASASVLPTRGGPFAIVFTGSNVGPLDVPTSTYDADNPPTVTATYGNGGDGATYEATGCVVTNPGSEVTCSAVDEGVGRSHVWNVTVSSPGSPAFSALSTFETAYEAPAVAATAADGPLPTAGGGLVTLTGSGFAPYCGTFCADGLKACGGDCVGPGEPCDAEPYDGGACQALLEGAAAITFGRSAALVAEFSCGDVAVTTPGALAVGAETTLTCVAGEGYGEAKFWALTVGVAAASSFFARTADVFEDAAGIVYAPPSISSVAIGGVESSQALRTAGGETLEIFGENFGPAGAGLADVSVAYANGIYAHEARAATSPYGPPVVDSASGGGLNEAATVGGDTFYLEGDNLGPAGSEVFVSYGPASRPDLYAAAACGVVVAHAKLSCETATGTGGGHVVRATVGNQTSAAYDANLTYAAPFVSYYESSWASDEDRVGAFAEGGEQLKLHGGNFGPLGNASLDSVSYLAADDDERYVACDVDGALGGVVGGDSPCLCAITTAHETVTCRTVAATGRGHSWHVVVDGQTSTTPTTRVEPPRVLGLLGNATNASIAGGEAIVIVGANFGRLQRKLDYVRYGPSGDEYEATNCTLASDSRVACLTAPGVGVDLRVTVAVDGQASDVSPPLLSYARPRIFGVSPQSGDTAGGSVHVVNGTNLGLAFARTYVQIVFDGAVVPLDGASLTRASPGASGYSYYCGAADDHGATVLDSNGVTFEYGGPVVESLSNTDNEAYGRTDLVLTGLNFGTYGAIYVNEEPQVVTSWAHDRITLTYDGTTGVVYVNVGDKYSASVEFSEQSPRIIVDVAAYQPDPAGYRTSGLDDDEAPAVSSLIGYYFSDSAASTRVLVGGVEATIVSAGAVVDPSTFTSTLVIQGRTVRRVDYEIPPGAGKANDVVLYANGRPSYSANLTEDVLYVRYRAPEVAASSPGLVPTYGGSVTLAGDNFGAAAADATVTLGGVVCEATAWTHDEVTVSVPAGAGDGKKLVVEVAGQAATVAPGDNGAVAYEPPTLDAVSPAELPTLGGSVTFASIPLAFRASTLETLTPSAAKTTGGTALALNGSDFGIGSNVNVEFCCGWSSAGPVRFCSDVAFCGGDAELLEVTRFSQTAVGLLSPTGQAEGPLTVTLSACADIGDPATSACVEAACDRFSEGGCGLETAGGYEIAIVGANFGIEKPRVVFGGVEVDDDDVRQPSGEASTHELLYFTVPRGVGAGLAVSVAVGDFVSPPRAFSYDPPYVSRIAYPNAAGDRIQFSGKNFGETEALAGDSLYIHVAGQNVSFPEADEKITMVCAADYYGQTALAAYETDFGCADVCDAAQEFCLGVGGEAWVFDASDDGTPHFCDGVQPCRTIESAFDGSLANCSVITLEDEFCAEKPVGSVVDHSNAGEPYSLAGYFRLDKRDDDAIPCDAWHAHRDTYCDELRPCSPSGACAGNNTCDAGYTDTMCAKCCDVSMAYLDDGKTKNPECWDGGDQLLYYRAYGECVECPTNYALLVALLTSAVLVLSVFATTEIEWPSELQRLYSSLAIFSFDFLDVFPPECSISVEYDVQWLAIQFGPLGLAAACYAFYFFRRSYLVWKYAHKKKEMFKRMRRLKGMITSTLLYGFYFIYLYMCENTLDPLNCQRIAAEDGATETKREYLSSEPNEVCWQEGEMQYSLVPIAVVFVFVYILGYPLIIAALMYPAETRRLIRDDQLLRCQGRGRYEEGLTEYLDDVSASFQLAMLLMVLFTSCVFQMKYLPYLSSSNHDEIFTKYADRIKILHDEELSSAAAKDKAIRMARGKAVGKLTFASMTTRELRDSAAKLFFEYNTVEGVLLEIVTHIFPSLSCSCFSVFADGETREKDDDEIFDDGIEMAAGNPHLQKKMDDLMKDDQQLLSIKEQVEIKKLVGKLQTECRNLKRELADAKASSPRAAVPVKKKKVVGGIAHDPRDRSTSAAVDMDDEAVSPRRPSGFAGAAAAPPRPPPLSRARRAGPN